MEKLGWRDRRISPDSGSLFQTILRANTTNMQINPKAYTTPPHPELWLNLIRVISGQYQSWLLDGTGVEEA
ncbi:hypothetical protein [Stutzerimonas nitrititolerans]|uniref:hypothetical protein n=1 Tax=Stutzerimonas nitrititolerans TaxID=2482751 RepID=UPI0028AE4066|nr:hypothetical protein [Stutzerimonas nitrititolerans]